MDDVKRDAMRLGELAERYFGLHDMYNYYYNMLVDYFNIYVVADNTDGQYDIVLFKPLPRNKWDTRHLDAPAIYYTRIDLGNDLVENGTSHCGATCTISGLPAYQGYYMPKTFLYEGTIYWNNERIYGNGGVTETTTWFPSTTITEPTITVTETTITYTTETTTIPNGSITVTTVPTLTTTTTMSTLYSIEQEDNNTLYGVFMSLAGLAMVVLGFRR